jgi:DNA end-binding protein Ku
MTAHESAQNTARNRTYHADEPPKLARRLAMRSIWKGHISFGLVNIPASLYSAERRSDLRLHMIDTENTSRVRYQRVNEETGEEVPWDRIAKGFEYDDGNYVVLGDAELQNAAPEKTQAVEIQAFVNQDHIDLMYFDKPYFLEPRKKGEKGYALLREVLRESGKAAIAKVVIRTRQYIAAMVPRHGALVLILLRYEQELRDPDELDLPGSIEQEHVTDQELKMARTLVDSMDDEWDPSLYRDEYREALMAAIERKIETGELRQAPEAEDVAESRSTTDLMEALRRSVSHSEEDRAERDPKRKKSRKKAPKKSGSSSKRSTNNSTAKNSTNKKK